MARILTLAIALGVCLFAGSCGGAADKAAVVAIGVAPANLAAKLPGLPRGKEAAGLTETLILGKNTQLRSTNAIDNGSALDLDPSVSGFEWGIYGFSAANPLDSVSVLLSATGGAYIGLANYTRGTWDFFGPYTGQKTLATDTGDYLSPGGNLYVAVLSTSGATTIDALSVRTLNPANVLPQVTLTSDVNSGAAPLTVQFTAAASDSDGSIIEYAWDWDGDGGYDTITDNGTFSHTFTTAGTYDVKVRVTDDQFGRATDTLAAPVTVTGGGNAPPVAALSINPPNGPGKGQSFTLDASASTDSDGAIILYEWDLDDNGSFETVTGTTPNFTMIQMIAGDYNAHVRVTDDDGAQDTADVAYTVHGWEVVTVDGISGGSNYNSVGMVDGHVAIAYYETGGANDLIFVRSTTVGGNHDSDWINKVLVDQPGDVGLNPSMTIVNGNPAISYYDSNNEYLRYARSTTPDGNTGDWTNVTVDTGGAFGAGEYSSLRIVGGKPAIAYKRFDAGSGHLAFAHSSTPGGMLSGNWSKLDVDTADGSGEHPQLAIVNSLPAICYYDSGDVQLRYVQSTTASGSATGDWAGTVIVKNTACIPSGDLLTPGGNPAIAYYESGLVKYVRSTTINGTLAGDWSQDSVINPNNSFFYMSLIGGKPAICYLLNAGMNSSLKFVQSTSVDGALQSDWSGSTTVDSDPFITPKEMSMTEVNGNPAFAWCDSPTALRYAIMY